MSERCAHREIWPLEQEGHRAPRLVPAKDMSIPCITDSGMELLSPHGARHHADEAVGGAGKAEDHASQVGSRETHVGVLEKTGSGCCRLQDYHLSFIP